MGSHEKKVRNPKIVSLKIWNPTAWASQFQIQKIKTKQNVTNVYDLFYLLTQEKVPLPFTNF